MKNSRVFDEARFKVRKERMDTLLSELFNKKGSGRNSTYTTRNPLSLYEVTLHCLQNPSRIQHGSDSEEEIFMNKMKNFYTESITKVLPHLVHRFEGAVEKNSWLSGVIKEEEKKNLVSEYAKSELPLATASWAEFCRNESWSENSAIQQSMENHNSVSMVSTMQQNGGSVFAASVVQTEATKASSGEGEGEDDKDTWVLLGSQHQ